MTYGNDSAMPIIEPGLGKYGEPITSVSFGLTKRELFAAMAMQGFVQHAIAETFASVSVSAVKMANALIDELNKDTNEKNT